MKLHGQNKEEGMYCVMTEEEDVYNDSVLNVDLPLLFDVSNVL